MSTTMYDYETRTITFREQVISTTDEAAMASPLIPVMVKMAKEYDYLSETIERDSKALSRYATRIAEAVANGENALTSGMPIERLTADIQTNESKRMMAAETVAALVYTMNKEG